MRSIDMELAFDPDDWEEIRIRLLDCEANQAWAIDRLFRSDLMKAAPLNIVTAPTIRELLGVKQPCKRVRFNWREIRINEMKRRAEAAGMDWKDEWIGMGLLTEASCETV